MNGFLPCTGHATGLVTIGYNHILLLVKIQLMSVNLGNFLINLKKLSYTPKRHTHVSKFMCSETVNGNCRGVLKCKLECYVDLVSGTMITYYWQIVLKRNAYKYNRSLCSGHLQIRRWSTAGHVPLTMCSLLIRWLRTVHCMTNWSNCENSKSFPWQIHHK